MSTITISRQIGTLGTEIARGVAEELGYDYVDKEKIENLLAEDGLGAGEIQKFDEKKPPFFWDALSIQRTRFLHSLQAAIYDLARKGRAVIVGRGGQVLLRTLPGTLHVRIYSPFEVRVKRVAEREKISEKMAIRMLRQGDHESAGYISSFFHADWKEPNLYDLQINTSQLSPATARQMIIDCVRSRDIQDGVEKGKARLGELALVQKAEAKLVPLLGAGIHQVEVRPEKGGVSLRGTVASAALKEECERAVAALEGVKQVDNQLVVTQYRQYST